MQTFLNEQEDDYYKQIKAQIVAASSQKELNTLNELINTNYQSYDNHCSLEVEILADAVSPKPMPEKYKELLRLVVEKEKSLIINQPSAILKKINDFKMGKIAERDKEKNELEGLKCKKEALEKDQKFLTTFQEIISSISSGDYDFNGSSEYFKTKVINAYISAYGGEITFRGAISIFENLTGYTYLLLQHNNKNRDEDKIFDAVKNKKYLPIVSEMLDQAIEFRENDLKNLSLQIKIIENNIAKPIGMECLADLSGKQLRLQLDYESIINKEMSNDPKAAIQEIKGILQWLQDQNNLNSKLKSELGVSDADLESKGDDAVQGEPAQFCKDFADVVQSLIHNMQSRKDGIEKNLPTYITVAIGEYINKNINNALDGQGSLTNLLVGYSYNLDNEIDKLSSRKESERDEYDNQLLENLKAKQMVVIQLIKKDGFISMCEGIDRLNTYGAELKSSCFTTGTDDAQGECLDLSSKLKDAVIECLKGDTTVEGLPDVIKDIAAKPVDRMINRNVFTKVAKFFAGIFEFIGRRFGHAPDFFKPKRKELGEAVLAQANSMKSAL